MVMLLRWSVQWRENGHVTEVDNNRESMIVREVVVNGGRMVMLQRWSV